MFFLRCTVLASASSGQNQFNNCATVTSKSQPRNTQLDKVLVRTISAALRMEWSSGRTKMEKHAENVSPSTRCDSWRSVAGCFAGGSNFCLQDVWTSDAKSASQSAVTKGWYVYTRRVQTTPMPLSGRVFASSNFHTVTNFLSFSHHNVSACWRLKCLSAKKNPPTSSPPTGITG